jgi:hypothetical protein
MNILTDTLPETVVIDGLEYKLNTDFRAALRVIMAFEDVELTGYEKQVILIKVLYQQPPALLQEAVEKANWFLNGGKTGSTESDGTRLYSFAKDADFIFAAFRQTHGIDLRRAELHWWEFMALFMDLGSETTFSSLISLRKRVKNGTATKEEKKAAQDMGELFDVPEVDTRTVDEKEAEREFMRLIKGGE